MVGIQKITSLNVEIVNIPLVAAADNCNVVCRKECIQRTAKSGWAKVT